MVISRSFAIEANGIMRKLEGISKKRDLILSSNFHLQASDLFLCLISSLFHNF
jgi:hypothetical protein